LKHCRGFELFHDGISQNGQCERFPKIPKKKDKEIQVAEVVQLREVQPAWGDPFENLHCQEKAAERKRMRKEGKER